MGAIKDIVDLIEDLESRAKDRRDMDAIHKIHALAFSLQSQHADIIERDVNLMSQNAELQRKLEQSQSEEIRIHCSIEFRRGKRTGGNWMAFCPKCHMPASGAAGLIDVACSDGGCKWKVRLNGVDLPAVIKELP